MISLSKISINFNGDSTSLLFNSSPFSSANTTQQPYLQHQKGRYSGTAKTAKKRKKHFISKEISTLLVELLSSETNNNRKAIANARQTTALVLMFVGTKEY